MSENIAHLATLVHHSSHSLHITLELCFILTWREEIAGSVLALATASIAFIWMLSLPSSVVGLLVIFIVVDEENLVLWWE